MLGELVTEGFAYDGGREVTVYVPPSAPEAVLYAGDGQVLPPWGQDLEDLDLLPTMIVGVHRADDETDRLHEYSPGFDPDRFAAHERFLIGDVMPWVGARFGIDVPVARTAVWGVSAGGELALALGVRRPGLFGAVLCASPGAGFRPPAEMTAPPSRAYFLAGTEEPFFLDNARRWASALEDAGSEVQLVERPGGHGDAFWRTELPAMVEWAFGRTPPRSAG